MLGGTILFTMTAFYEVGYMYLLSDVKRWACTGPRLCAVGLLADSQQAYFAHHTAERRERAAARKQGWLRKHRSPSPSLKRSRHRRRRAPARLCFRMEASTVRCLPCSKWMSALHVLAHSRASATPRILPIFYLRLFALSRALLSSLLASHRRWRMAENGWDHQTPWPGRVC